MFNVIIGKIKHAVGNFIRFYYHAYLKAAGVDIGFNCMISLGAKIDTRRGKVVIANNCVITHGVVILAHDASEYKISGHSNFFKTKLEDNVFVGVNSVILPGVTVHEGAVVGAGSVVTKNVPSRAIVAGNPARLIKYY